jgi:hypothetical protein
LIIIALAGYWLDSSGENNFLYNCRENKVTWSSFWCCVNQWAKEYDGRSLTSEIWLKNKVAEV